MSSSEGRGRCGESLRPNAEAAGLVPPHVTGVCPRAATVPCLHASKDSLLRYFPREVGSSPPLPSKHGRVQRAHARPPPVVPAAVVVASQAGESCGAACAREGRGACHVAAFAHINTCSSLAKHLPCDQGCMVRARALVLAVGPARCRTHPQAPPRR